MESLALSWLELHDRLEYPIPLYLPQAVEHTKASEDRQLFFLEHLGLPPVLDHELLGLSGPDGDFSKIDLCFVGFQYLFSGGCGNLNEVDFGRCIRVVLLLEINRQHPFVMLGHPQIDESSTQFPQLLLSVEVLLHFKPFLFFFPFSLLLLFFFSLLLGLKGFLLSFAQFLCSLFVVFLVFCRFFLFWFLWFWRLVGFVQISKSIGAQFLHERVILDVDFYFLVGPQCLDHRRNFEPADFIMWHKQLVYQLFVEIVSQDSGARTDLADLNRLEVDMVVHD